MGSNQSFFNWLTFLADILGYKSHTIQLTLLKCTTQWFLVYSEGYVTNTAINFKTFITFKRNPSPISSHSPFLSNPFSSDLCLYRFSCSGHSYKCNQTILGFVCQAFFTSYKCFQVSIMLQHVPAHHSFLLLHNILLYEYKVFYSSIHQLMAFFYFHYWLERIMLVWTFIFVWTYIFTSLGCTHRRISGSYGNSTFNLLRNRKIVFQIGCTISHGHSLRVPPPPLHSSS